MFGEKPRRSRAKGGEGMKAAAEHAERQFPGWRDSVLKALGRYLGTRKAAPFLAEDFVQWARFRVKEPPDGRAWGNAMKAAAAKGIIQKVGYAPAESSNYSPKVLWQAVL
jgi:hypothetical protein